jgi:uncharacterized protein YbjT (DUF2867 family)
MTKVVILGAGGQIARHAIQQFLELRDVELTLFLRKPHDVRDIADDHVRVVKGDTTDTRLVEETVRGQDVVYANLAGDNIEDQARSVVAALDAAGVRRLIWISTLGIYDEVPGAFGKWNHEQLDGGYLEPYSAAASVIEGSDLDYTIIRPAWLTDKDEVDYELTHKGEFWRASRRFRTAPSFAASTPRRPRMARSPIGIVAIGRSAR